MMLSANLARCIARISGDGNLYSRYIRYSNHSDVLREEFIKDIKKEFGNITITKGIGNSGTPFVQINRQFVIKKFINEISSYKSNDIYIPDSIKKSNKSIKREYLRCLFDDEGCVAIRIYKRYNEWKRNITLSSNSIQLLKDVKKVLLKDFCIKTNKIIRNRNKTLF